MSKPEKRKSRHKHFWRACQYLWPYRAYGVISVVCAFFVALSLTSGLTALLPLLRVLINGDTVPEWAYRQTAELRLNVRLNQDPGLAQIVLVTPGGPAAAAGLKPGDIIAAADAPSTAPPSPFPPSDPIYRAGEILRHIARADVQPLHLIVAGRSVAVTLKTPYWFAAASVGLNLTEKLPLRPVPAVAAVFALMGSLAVLGQCVRFFQEYLSDKAGILAVNDIRRRLYDRVLRVPMQFFGQKGTSDVTSRLVSDAATLQDGFKQVLGQSVQEPIKALMALGLALLLSWRLTVFILLFCPIMYAIVKKFGKKMRRASRAALQSSSIMLGQLESTLMGIRVVKASSAERYERRRYMKIMAGLVREQLRMSRTDALSAPVLETAIMLMVGCVVLVATHLVVLHTITAEEFLVVMGSLAVIAESLRRVSKVSNALQKADAAAARIFESLDLPVEREHRPPPDSFVTMPRKLPALQNSILFEGVTFGYGSSPNPAVDRVDLRVPKGQSCAIVGRNGSGKTTLLALLPRFYDPQSGRITIDGTDIRSVTLASLRRQISIVTQDSVIFPGTIAQNIAYGNPLAAPDAPDSEVRRALLAEIEAAARRAFAHDFIIDKPDSYHTPLGEMGGQLSGGQKQRLCIARAILRKSPILILDEATSQVDAESEHLIQQATDTLMHERTTFVIAHRFSTIVSADTIVVMERGRIVGQGKHDDLLRTCETYQQLYERQLFAAAPITPAS
ncbi:MAG: ABC transporter transmembrane domain-containing protein [Tepidisphaeraceae bacterium]